MQASPESSAPVSDADRRLLVAAYEAFNVCEMDALLATMHPAVAWPQNREGNYLHGHAQVRAHWSQGWANGRTRDEPVEMYCLPDGRVAVLAHQTKHDHSGNLLREGKILYAYTLREGLIQHMEIQAPPS